MIPKVSNEPVATSRYRVRNRPTTTWTVGDRVTTATRKEAFYSGRNGLPVVWFEPGMVGVIGSVRDGKPGKNGYQTDWCVDFTVPGKPSNTHPDHPSCQWRVVLTKDLIRYAYLEDRVNHPMDRVKAAILSGPKGGMTVMDIMTATHLPKLCVHTCAYNIRLYGEGVKEDYTTGECRYRVQVSPTSN